MKKILCFLLTAVLICTVTACESGELPGSENSTSSSKDDDTATVTTTAEITSVPASSASEIPAVMKISDSKISAALKIFTGDTYSYEIDFGIVEGSAISVYRKGDNIYSDLGGIKAYLVDGEYYELSPFNDTATFRVLNKGEIAEQIEKISNPYLSMVDLKGAGIIEVGTDEYGDGELYYENILQKNGESVRAFFDGDMLVGLKCKQIESYGGNWLEVKFEVKDEVDDSVFEIPPDLEIVP
ncbi:MAG: hypothetical protein FWF82_06025 [Oscillospiraceae bacterium]|nr:hypothetical protein [Oscillospiraceae bacterium]